MVKPIRDCRRCGSGNVLQRRHPNYGPYSVCLQCGRDELEIEDDERAVPSREMQIIRGQALPDLSTIRIWQGQA